MLQEKREGLASGDPLGTSNFKDGQRPREEGERKHEDQGKQPSCSETNMFYLLRVLQGSLGPWQQTSQSPSLYFLEKERHGGPPKWE